MKVKLKNEKKARWWDVGGGRRGMGRVMGEGRVMLKTTTTTTQPTHLTQDA